MNPTLAIVCVENRLAAWYLAPSSVPRSLNIHGQRQLDVTAPEILTSAYIDLSDRLRDEGISVVQVHWLIDRNGRTHLEIDFPQRQGHSSTSWQVLAWEWIAEHFGLNEATLWESPNWLESHFLPWLTTAGDATDRHDMLGALANTYRTESERLASECAKLELENKCLREQNTALQQVDMERLASFLPALFQRVFTVLSGSDLALLCGRLEPVRIPNPYPEPSEESLRRLQKNFRSLPRQIQQQIADFVAQLPQRQKLQPRPEMRELLHELESA